MYFTLIHIRPSSSQLINSPSPNPTHKNGSNSRALAVHIVCCRNDVKQVLLLMTPWCEKQTEAHLPWGIWLSRWPGKRKVRWSQCICVGSPQKSFCRNGCCRTLIRHRICYLHIGHLPATRIYRSWGLLAHRCSFFPSMEVWKKCAPGSIHDSYM